LIVAANVEEFPPTLKPCFVKARGIERGSFIRTFDGDRSLSTYEVHVLQASRGQPDEDGATIQGASPADLDPVLT
jgi:ATP-dependent DNA helicase RecG